MALSLLDLLHEYDTARRYTDLLTADVDDDALVWRPRPTSSAIGWHLGHQAAVNHYLIRNLLSAEPSPDPDLDTLFDSATPEPERGDLPARDRLVRYRDTIAERTWDMISRIDRGEVGAPNQLPAIAAGVLVAATNHEYQHDTWVGEMRHTLGLSPATAPGSDRVTLVDGYWLLEG